MLICGVDFRWVLGFIYIARLLQFIESESGKVSPSEIVQEVMDGIEQRALLENFIVKKSRNGFVMPNVETKPRGFDNGVS